MGWWVILTTNLCAEMSKARDYTFTAFQDAEPTFGGNCSYLVYGAELCPETARHHWQGYAEFSSPKTLTACQKTLGIGKSHVGARLGTPGEAAGYCKKGDREKPEAGWGEFMDDEVVRGGEFGERRKEPHPGERVDISAFRDAIKRGASDAELLDEHVGCVAKYQKMIAFTRNAYSSVPRLPQGTRQDMGIWVWGPTDTGKSTQIPVEVFDKSSNKWWCGYVGEPVVLVDDPTPIWAGQCMGWLKQWVQEKPFNAEVKGGSCKVRFKKIVVTCNKSMKDYFGDAYDEAILSRFTEHYVGTREEVTALYNKLLADNWFN